jgi:hypothetical protein
LGRDLFKIIETLIFNAMNLLKYGIGAAKNDTFIKQVRYENTTDKGNESIHLELSTPTYAKSTYIPNLEYHSVCPLFGIGTFPCG